MFSAAYSEKEPIIAIKDPHFVVTRRTSVSAECDQPDSDKTAVERNGTVSEAAIEALSKIFLFQGLSSESLVQVARALTPRSSSAGEIIIKKGDEGDFFYILENGTVRYEIDGKHVGTAGTGSCFGELALMYNSPRAATVIADDKCSLWALDRTSFKSIMVKTRREKREHSLEVLENVDLLGGLDQTAKLRLADVLYPQTFAKGEVVVREGEAASCFYLVDEGRASITVGGKEVTPVGRGDYFGELALLDNSPRAATVTADTELKVGCLSKEAFERMLGPEVIAELRRRDPRKN